MSRAPGMITLTLGGLPRVNERGAFDMMSVEAACLSTLARLPRRLVHSRVLNAALNPGSPVFLATARHLQEALAILTNIDPVAAVATVAGLGVLVAWSRLGLR